MHRRFLAGEKACPDPGPDGAQGQDRRQAFAIGDAASGDDRNGHIAADVPPASQPCNHALGFVDLAGAGGHTALGIDRSSRETSLRGLVQSFIQAQRAQGRRFSDGVN